MTIIKFVVQSIIITIIGVCLLSIVGKIVRADIIDLKELSISYKSFDKHGSDPLITQNIPNRGLGEGLDLTLNTTVLKYLYWDNLIHTTTDVVLPAGKGQFRLIGWQIRLGAQLSDNLQIGYYHHSQHLLDTIYPDHFPLQDALEIKFTLHKDNKYDSIF